MKLRYFLILALLPVASFAQQVPLHREIRQPAIPGSGRELTAVETLVARNVVVQGAAVVYRAGKSVALQPGFSAQAGSVFEAVVGPVSAEALPEESGFSLRALPNPFSDRLTVEYVLPQANRVRTTLTGANGQVLHQEESAERRSAGMHRWDIDTQLLPSGVYVFQLQAGGDGGTLKVLKK